MAALAIADISFFVLLLPDAIGQYRLAYTNNDFRLFYYKARIHIVGLLNWFSATAIWYYIWIKISIAKIHSFRLILGICMERLIAIRCEFKLI